MQNIQYMVLINLQNLEIGLRQDSKYYYLDFLAEHNDKTVAIQKYKKLKSDSSLAHLDINNNEHKLILITNIITEYVLSVK